MAFIVGELMTPDTVGGIAGQDADAVAITGGTITGITDLAVADGGTGAGTDSGARANLGLGTIATQDRDSILIEGGNISDTAVTNTVLNLKTYSVSSLPGGNTAGDVAYCTDGDGGSPCLAVNNGSAWKRVVLGATVST